MGLGSGLVSDSQTRYVVVSVRASIACLSELPCTSWKDAGRALFPELYPYNLWGGGGGADRIVYGCMELFGSKGIAASRIPLFSDGLLGRYSVRENVSRALGALFVTPSATESPQGS